MTATELYEIVKDHPDVWGKVLKRDGEYWMDAEDPATHIGVACASAALLGLGVKWLLDNTRTDIGIELSMATISQTPLVKAVYSAIKDAKREAQS